MIRPKKRFAGISSKKAMKSYEEAYGIKLTKEQKIFFARGWNFGVADCYIKLKVLPKSK